ncbi:MAG TPA: DUF3108 domain-containing protein [Opitutaceae bacterium]|nr:DUF3108 domain-containing protein [Opitutaceae bacterium]
MRFALSVIFRFLAFAMFAVPVLSANPGPFTAFADGETFTYRVAWGIFFHAGEIVIAAHEEQGADGATLLRITTDTATHGFVREFYTYNNRAEGVIDEATGRLLLLREKGSDGEHFTDSETTFDYSRRIASYVDRAHPDRTAQVPIPPGDPLDLISVLVDARNWDLKPGAKRNVLVNFGNEFFPLALYAEGYDEVRTPLGRFRTLVLVPRMEENPKGIFKRGGEIKVWISQEGQKLPVKMQLKLKFGAATLSLTDYRKTAAPEKPAR